MSNILKGLQLNELSNEKLGQYKKAAGADAKKADSEGDYKRGDKRFSGIVRATKKQFDNDEKKKVAEGSEFGANYAEQLAQKVFNVKPKLASEDDVLNIGHKVATQDLMSQVRANYLFARDQDFPSDFVSAYYYLQKGNLNEFAPVGGDDREPNEEEILRQLAAKWWLGTEQEMAKAQKTLEVMGWEIGQDESGDDDAGVFVVRAGDENGDSYIAFNHSDLEELNEAYNNYHANNTGFSRPKRDLSGEGEPEGMFMVIVDGRPWKEFTSNQAFSRAKSIATKNPDRKVQVRWPTGQLNTVAEGLDDWATEKEKIRSMSTTQRREYALAKLASTNDDKYAHIAQKAGAGHSEIMNALKGRQGVAEGLEEGNLYAMALQKYPQLKRVDRETVINALNNAYEDYLMHYGYEGIGPEEESSMIDHAVKGLRQGVAEEQHSCPHCGGEMVSEELMNEKKDACYYKVKSRYKVWPSAYASGALVKCRNKGASNWGNGGKKNESSILEGIERADESLHDWFNKEKWVRMDTKGNIKGPCAKEPGEGKPKCLPQAKAHSLGKKGRASAAQRKRREDPNPERTGKAINVNTKKKD